LQGEIVISFIHACLSALYPETATAVLRNSVQKNHHAFSNNFLFVLFSFQRLTGSTSVIFSSRVDCTPPLAQVTETDRHLPSSGKWRNLIGINCKSDILTWYRWATLHCFFKSSKRNFSCYFFSY